MLDKNKLHPHFVNPWLEGVRAGHATSLTMILWEVDETGKKWVPLEPGLIRVVSYTRWWNWRNHIHVARPLPEVPSA